ncbi:MAG: hypothetical protein ABI237_06045 [Ginsengibacter sp.]
MASDVLINFVGDATKLQSSIDALDQLAAKEGAIGDKWKQVSTAMDSQNKTNVDGTNKLASSVQNLSDASGKLPQSVVGGAYSATLKDLQTQIAKFSTMGAEGARQIANQLDALIVKENSLRNAITQTFNPELIQKYNTALQQNIEQQGILGGALDNLKGAGIVLNDFAPPIENATTKTVNFTTQIRNLRNQLLAMSDAGQQGTAEFQTLTTRFAEMQRASRQFQIESKGLVQNNVTIAGTLDLVSGVAGAYAVAQGAAALFGDSNSDLAKALLKVNAAMAILQGLQQVIAVLQKSSTASILLDSLVRKANTAAITDNAVASTADAGAKTLEAVGTEGATAAQIGLNTAMLASPIGILILSVGVLIGLYQIFEQNSAKAAEAQRQLNVQLADAVGINDSFVSAISQAGKELVLQLQLQGKSQDQIRKQQTQTLNDQITQQTNFVNANAASYEAAADKLRAVSEGRIKLNADEITGLEKTRDQYDAIQKKLFELQGQLRELNLNNALADNKESLTNVKAYADAKVAATIAGTDAERAAQIQSIKDVSAAREKDVDFLSQTEAQKAAIRAGDERQLQALQLQNYQHYLAGRTAAVDAQIALVKSHQATSDSDEIAQINKLTDLQIAAIKRQQAAQLANPTLNTDEREKINDETNLAIIEAEKKKQADILAIQKNEIALQLAASEKGTYDEEVLKLASIELQRQAEILAAGKNADLIKAINDKYNKERIDQENAFSIIQLQNEVSRDTTALNNFKLTEQEKLPIVIKRLNDQESIELIAANNNAAKIAEIQADYDQKRIAAEKATNAAILADNIKTFDGITQLQTTKNNLILSNPLSDDTAKYIANDEILRNEKLKTDLARDSLEKDKLIISQDEYEQRLQAIKNQEDADNLKHSQTAVKIFKDEQASKLALIQSAIGVIQNGLDTLDTSSLQTGLTQVLGLYSKIGKAIADNKGVQNDPNATDQQKQAADQSETDAIITASIVATQATLNQVFSDAAAQRAQELQDNLQGLEDQKNVELNNANLTAKQKDAINKEYADKERAVKIKAFNADKEAKKEQAVINGLLAVTNALATVQPFIPAGLIAAGIAAALTAVQVVAIGAQPTPKFRHGQIDIQGPGTGTSDSIHAKISRGESVIAAEPTARWKEVLIAINKGTYQDMLSKKIDTATKWKETLVAINNNKVENYIMRNMHDFVFPHIPSNVQPIRIHQKEIDYDRLSNAIAEKMRGVIPESKSMEFNIDKDGMHTLIKNGNSKIEYKNKRYKMS